MVTRMANGARRVHLLDCTFCGAFTQAEQLSRWAAPSLTLSIPEAPGDWQVVCACHPDPNAPPPPPERSITIRSWRACQECRADIDAGQWEGIVVRSRVTRRRMGEPPEQTEHMDAIQRSRDALVQQHVAPGETARWSPIR